jgi:CheY-like chemotaxis protein
VTGKAITSFAEDGRGCYGAATPANAPHVPAFATGRTNLQKTNLLLLVEDEALILELAKCALEDAGYAALEASGGSEAIALLDAQSHTLAGLITDVRLEDETDGWQVARHARALRPELPIVYMTGDSAADWFEHGVARSLLVQKPFGSVQLIAAISTLLGEPRSNPG